MQEIDLCGLKCPMPVLRVKRALKDVAGGQTMAFVTDDPHAVADIRVFATQSGHTVVSQSPIEGGRTRHVLQKRPN